MDDAKVDVLGLSEVRWNQSGDTDTNDGKRLIYSHSGNISYKRADKNIFGDFFEYFG
jgi:hypothetical protein